MYRQTVNIFGRIPLILLLAMVVLFTLAFVPQTPVSAAGAVQITELMYNPPGNGSLEFIELYNSTSSSISISGWVMQGVDFTFPSGTTIPAKGYAVVVRNKPIFQATFPGVKILGQYPGKLVGTGELVRLANSGNSTISQVEYRNGGNWPSSANGTGPSLSLIQLGVSESHYACWAPSSGSGGTPGKKNSLQTSWVNSNSSSCPGYSKPAPPSGSGSSSGGSSAPAPTTGGTGSNSSETPESAAMKRKQAEAKERKEAEEIPVAPESVATPIESDAVTTTEKPTSRAMGVVALFGLVSIMGIGALIHTYVMPLWRQRKGY